MRDQVLYALFRDEAKALQTWADTGEIDLCYGDEMGVSRQAVVPYGWQPVGKSTAFMLATPNGKKTILILDNASTNTSALFRNQLAIWRTQSLRIQYIPAYYPELNSIECLWKQIKFHWFNPVDFLSASSLRIDLQSILAGIGTKYHITLVRNLN